MRTPTATVLPLIVLLLTAARWATAAELPAYQYPQAVVPFVGGSPPTIDGIIQPQEYQRYAAITGMVTWGTSGGIYQGLVPQIQQVVWYLGYDDKYLYLAMRSPNPPGGWPLAKTKGLDPGNAILWDDHVEIQIAKERDTATFPGRGFYKIMANAKTAFQDEWFYNGTPGTEGAWSYLGQFKSGVTAEHWDLEIAADIRAFDVKSLDGQTWVLQLLRADAPGGIYFAGWVGETWMAWDKFGEVTFDRTAPVFRFLDCNDLVRGKMDLKFELTGQTDDAVPVTVQVKVTDGAGNTLFDETKQETAKGGEVRPLSFTGNLALTDTGNRLEIVATYPATGADGEPETRTLYRFQAPIIKLTDAYYNQHIAPWLAQRPKGDFDWSFAYWPSYGVAKTAVDLDFFGLDEKVAQASAFKVTVKQAGSGRVISSATASIKDKGGRTVVKGLDLPEGDYVAEMELIGADGKSVVGTRKIDFVRRRYEWEGNKLGISDRVIPPFTAIEANGLDFSVWARQYSIGNDGLLTKIVAGQGAGPEPILTAPMQLVASEKGQAASVSAAECKVERSSPGHVGLTATGKLGSADYRVSSYLEYDGWYNVRLTLTPPAGGTEFDSLALRIPLWPGADTLYVQRAGDVRRGNKFGAIPPGEGRVWSSAELLPLESWGSFCPIVFVGNGDKGLWWFADENRDWTMSDDKPAVELFRTQQGYELVLNFFAAPTSLNSPRTLEFAFLVDPVKQMPEERKWAWGKLRYSHNTFGYRYYGGSVDGFENTDEDLEALNRLFTDPTWKLPDDPDLPANWKGHANALRNHYYDVVDRNQMLVMYGSTCLTGLGLPAFDTYGGEWLGRTNWQPSPQTEFTGWWNSQHTVKWETPRQLTTVYANSTPAWEDCFVWYHYRLLAKTPINGTWWDNSSILVLEDYDPEREEFYYKFNIWSRRRLTKRLANIGWELGKQPWWINNMHVDWSFCQVSWHIENDFYIDNADATMMDQLPVDQFRALCRIKRGIIHRLATRSPGGTTEQIRRAGRSAAGMCLLHDIGSYLWGDDAKFAPDMLRLLDEKVGFFDGAEFLPYWRNAYVLKIDTPGVYASIYRGKGRAVIVVVNERREDQEVTFTLNPGIIPGGVIHRIYDGETGFAFAPLWDAEKRQPVWGEVKPGVFGMPASGVRLLVVE